MKSIEDYKDLHAGETALLVGNGENLRLTPPEWFDYPSFGLNTCHLWTGSWRPTYYTAVDGRVMREFSKAINDKLGDVTKFLPAPQLDKWKGENIVRFFHKQGSLWDVNKSGLWPSGIGKKAGLCYANVMHVALQLAYYMGFKTMIMIGVHHQPGKAQSHFWGYDSGARATPPMSTWLDGYKILVNGMAEEGVKVLNISDHTYVPESILPRSDWHEYTNAKETA